MFVEKYFVASNTLHFFLAKPLIRYLSEFFSKLVAHCANILNSRMYTYIK